jgi:hypothetical protein
VTERGGETVLRERVAALEKGKQQLLRHALDDAALA